MLSKFLNSKNGKTMNRTLAFMLVFTLTFANYMLIGMYFAESSISYAKEEKEVSFEVEQKFKTNKVYEVEEGFKRIVQLEITSEIKNTQGNAKFVLPETLIENKAAEEIKVNSYETDFTFENNKVSFEAKGKNIFNITYIYDEEYTYNEDEEIYEFGEEPELKSEKILVNVEIKDEEKIKARSEEIEYTEKVQFGDIVNLTETVTDIYKGNMYLKENTEYSKKTAVEVRDIEKDLFKDNFVITSDEKILNEEVNEKTEEIIAEEFENLVYYKSTIFSKTELLKLFGQEANIIITAKANETEKNTIILFSEYDEEEYKEYEIIDITKMDEEDEIIIEHEEEVTDVKIKTTVPDKEGIFNITHNKTIKLDEFVNVKKINKLESLGNIVCEETNFEVDIKNDYEIKEPETKATLCMEYLNSNQTVLSSLIDNKVNFTVNLLAKGPEHKLYQEPVIKILLPSTVKVESINDVALALEDGLKIKNSFINNNAIIVELQGEQENYNYDEMQQSISIGAVLKVDRTTPSGEIEIVSTCENGEDEEVSLKSIKANVFSPAELISVTNITVNGENSNSIEENNTIKINTFAEQTVANIDITLINNHGDTISGLKLEGILSDKESTFSTNLIDEIKILGVECEVEYFDGENKVEDIATAKTYVISIDEMKQGEQLNIVYTLDIPKNLPYNESLNTALNMDYQYDGNVNEKNLNMQLTTGKGPSAKVEVIPQVENEILNGGQVVTYNIKVINDGDENIPEAIFTYETIENAKIIQFTTLQGSIFEYAEDEDNKKEWNIKDFAVGEEVEAQVIVKLDNVKEKEEFLSKASLVAGEKTIEKDEIVKKVVPADFEIMMTTAYNQEIDYNEGDIIKYRIETKNVSGKDISNAKIVTKIPEYTELVKGYIHNNEKPQENYEVKDNKVIYNIEKILKEQTIVTILEVKVKELPAELNNELNISNNALVKAEGENTSQSNTIINKVYTADFDIHLTSNNAVTLEKDDNVEYNITVKNIGKRTAAVKIEDSVPNEISVNKVSYYETDDNVSKKYTSDSNIEVYYPLEAGKTLNVKIEGLVKDIGQQEENLTINNVAKVNLGNGNYLESEVVTNIINNEPQEQLESNNNENSPKEEKSTIESKKTHSILGIAWLDENEDGKRESTEKLLEGIEVLLVNATTGEVVENANKEKLVTKTSKDGSYNFEGLENGNYKVLFKYDTSKYQTTTYKKEGINSSVNSDVTMQNVTINEKAQKVALTDTITIKDSSVVNIDLGLAENDTFDLSLKKQIKKVTVKNNAGTTEYDFTNTDFAKIEIPGKNYKGSTLLIEYEIIVANEGDVTAYVTDIMDYMPKELTFNSEMNTNWYIDSEGILHDIALSMEGLEPGKQVSEKLVLTKTISSDGALTIENLAEIGSVNNTEGLEEKDSTSANKKDGEDDLGKAQLIVSVKTGGKWMYIGITLISLIIITLGIYLINKKVLKGNI